MTKEEKMNSVGRKWADFAHDILNIIPQVSVIAIIAVFMAVLGSNLALAQYGPTPTITPFIGTYDTDDVPPADGFLPYGALTFDVGSDATNTIAPVTTNFGSAPDPDNNAMIVFSASNYNYVGGASTDATVVIGNEVWLTTGIDIGSVGTQVRVIGGVSNTSAITNNAVIMVDGAVVGSITGGANQNSATSDGAGMTVSGNKEVIFDGDVGTVNGGVTRTSVTDVRAGTRRGATALDNQVWIKDGTFNGAVRGGAAARPRRALWPISAPY
ncbi:MAG: hypothetical protein LBO66_00080 [Deltaproteobacteria bacterium]|nr:hypothetical protein [Deltaproteobacteria bacterium]